VLARYGPSGHLVAIKYLHDADASAVVRFRDEAVLLQRVQSPHVAALYEFRELPRGAAIVMEAVDGTSLRALLDAHGTLAPEAALLILKGSLLGLDAAHRLGIVHRDYKPANVIVTTEGKSKLIDFGVAVFTGGRGGSGTPAYMAPEQWMRGAATPATDVYAATCVFFECVTGRRPFRGDSRPLAQVPVEEVPEPLRGLVVRGMAEDPSERPPSAGSFVAELETAASTAYGPDWEVRARAVLGGVAAGMLGGALLSAGLGTTTATASSTAAGTGLGTTLLGGASLTVISAVLGAAVTAGVGVFAVQKLNGDRSPARPVVAASAPPRPSLAYMTTSAVMVGGPDGRSRRIASLSGRKPGGSLVWSADGKWLAWTTSASQSSISPERVHLAAADGSKVHSWTCSDDSCGSAAFLGDRLVTVALTVDRPPELVLHPLDGGIPERTAITGLPQDPYTDDGFTSPYLATATEDSVIVTHGIGTSAYGGPVTYYRVSGKGRATKFFEAPGNVAPHAEWVAPDGRTLVYTGAERGGYCQHYEAVRLVDLTTAALTAPDMPDGYVTVNGAWYDESGVLNASFLPQERTCPDADPSVPNGSALFELRSDAWVRTGGGVVMSRFAEDGGEATLAGRDRTAPGTLTVSRDGRTTTVKKVWLFAWSP